jgi:hypothetical protein
VYRGLPAGRNLGIKKDTGTLIISGDGGPCEEGLPPALTTQAGFGWAAPMFSLEVIFGLTRFDIQFTSYLPRGFFIAIKHEPFPRPEH